jgi:hypothetical protein
MVCVRPALANGLVFNGCGAASPNVMGLTPEPVGARGYADGAIVLLVFAGDTGEELPMFVACCTAAGRAPPSTAAAAVFTPLSSAELPLAQCCCRRLCVSSGQDGIFCHTVIACGSILCFSQRCTIGCHS